MKAKNCITEEQPKNDFLAIYMDGGMKRKLERVAKKKKVGVSTLSRIWLSERLQAV